MAGVHAARPGAAAAAIPGDCHHCQPPLILIHGMRREAPGAPDSMPWSSIWNLAAYGATRSNLCDEFHRPGYSLRTYVPPASSLNTRVMRGISVPCGAHAKHSHRARLIRERKSRRSHGPPEMLTGTHTEKNDITPPPRSPCKSAVPAHRCLRHAYAVQVPVHVMFTMPWTPTKEFPHPMAVVQSINVAGALSALPNEYISGAANWFSYRAMDLYCWAGISGIMDAFRKSLGLPGYSMLGGSPAHALAGLRLPVTYLWSPALQPKPEDWGEHVAVCVRGTCRSSLSNCPIGLGLLRPLCVTLSRRGCGTPSPDLCPSHVVMRRVMPETNGSNACVACVMPVVRGVCSRGHISTMGMPSGCGCLSPTGLCTSFCCPGTCIDDAHRHAHKSTCSACSPSH